MLIFFDTEFTGLRKDTTLISIGLISENDKMFYFECCDFNWCHVNANHWIRDNIIARLKYKREIKHVRYLDGGIKQKLRHIYVNDNLIEGWGSKKSLRNELYEWLKSFNENIQLVSDVCHYDMVLFCDIFCDMFRTIDLPDFISPTCHDINQDIAKYLNISEKEAFDVNREEFAGLDKYTDNIHKHNALWDAKVIKMCYEKIFKNK